MKDGTFSTSISLLSAEGVLSFFGGKRGEGMRKAYANMARNKASVTSAGWSVTVAGKGAGNFQDRAGDIDVSIFSLIDMEQGFHDANWLHTQRNNGNTIVDKSGGEKERLMKERRKY